MNFLPVCLNIENAGIVVVGGGEVAEQKLKTLLLYTHNITVCALEIHSSIQSLPITLLKQPYGEEVLDGARMVYACTDDRKLNWQIASDARRRDILACVADDPVDKKALFTGADPDVVNTQEPMAHQPLIEAVPPPVGIPNRHTAPEYRKVDPKPDPLDLSYFSAAIFSSPSTVEAFEEV